MEQTIKNALFAIDSKRNASEYGVPTLDADTCRELLESAISKSSEEQKDVVSQLLLAKESLEGEELDFDSARHHIRKALRELR